MYQQLQEWVKSSTELIDRINYYADNKQKENEAPTLCKYLHRVGASDIRFLAINYFLLLRRSFRNRCAF